MSRPNTPNSPSTPLSAQDSFGGVGGTSPKKPAAENETGGKAKEKDEKNGNDTKEEVEAQQRPGGRANHVEEDLREHVPAREHAADGRVACRRRGVQLPREGIASACGRLGGLCREIDLNVDV